LNQLNAFTSAARWIWHPAGEGINQHVDFVRDFVLRAVPRTATVRIAADSDYQLWINGTALPGRQFPCYSHDRVFNTHEVARWLRPGRNRIAILAYFRGVDGFEYRLGRAGLLVQLEAGTCRVVSDGAWRCRLDPVYRSGELPRTTFQLGFTVEADAGREDRWREPGLRLNAGWKPAVELAAPTGAYWKTLRPCPLPLDARTDIVPATLIARGEVLRPGRGDVLAAGADSRFSLPEQTAAGQGAPSAAQQMMQDFRRMSRVAQPAPGPWRLTLPDKPGRGALALFDLGGEQFGHVRLVAQAPAGTVIEIAHGEHLEDLGVRAFVGGRHFADRFICRAGRHELVIPFRRVGARYLQLHVFVPAARKGTLVIEEIGVVPREYAGPVRAGFASADRLMQAVREVSVRTLRLGMTEHFADCPWREQALYGYDSRNSALFNYYTFGDYAYAAESLRLLGQGLRADGLLELCAPARVPITIPIFSLAWICAVRDHYLFSGRSELFREFEPAILRILEAFGSRHDARTGLFELFIGEAFWTFYEWAPGLDFKDGHSFGDDGKYRLDAPHNLYLIEAMDALADLLGYERRGSDAAVWRRRAGALRKAVGEFFWDERRGLFASFGDRRARWHYSAATQALALVTGVATAAQRARLQPRLFETEPGSRGQEKLIPMTLSTQVYGLKALRGAPEALQRGAYDALLRIYGGMALKGAGTLWETERGADEFDLAGSLCHAWSAAPLWFTQAYVLGVEPLAPGFKRFRVRPHPAGLPGADGRIPTPAGALTISWRRHGARLKVACQAPRNLRRTN
jgi:hypothetical protein